MKKKELKKLRDKRLYRKKNNLCRQCGKSNYKGSVFCQTHLIKHREYEQKRKGWKPWEPGSSGKKPLEEK